MPYIYGYLNDLSRGLAEPKPLTDNELNELRNLKKKVEYLKDQLQEEGSESEQEDDEEEVVDEVQPKKKNIKAQRAGVSAEVYGQWNQKGDFKPKVVQKSQDTRDKLAKRLLQAFMFNALDENEFRIVVDSIEEVKLKPGNIVIKEGDEGDCMYVVEQGQLTCTKVFKGNKEPTFLKEYQPGEGFGELALLYNAPRAATITAKTEAVCWKLDRDVFNHIVKDAACKKREKYENFLASVKILSSMDPYERSKIADALKEEKFKKGDYVIKEGELGNTFYLISEGEAIATKLIEPDKPAVQVLAYKRGDYFGERALLTNEARAANIIATVKYHIDLIGGLTGGGQSRQRHVQEGPGPARGNPQEKHGEL